MVIVWLVLHTKLLGYILKTLYLGLRYLLLYVYTVNVHSMYEHTICIRVVKTLIHQSIVCSINIPWSSSNYTSQSLLFLFRFLRMVLLKHHTSWEQEQNIYILLKVNIIQIIAFYILSFVSKTIWVLCVCRFCGRSVPPSITSTDNILTLLFVSDASVVTEGFSASYVSLNATTGTEYIV